MSHQGWTLGPLSRLVNLAKPKSPGAGSLRRRPRRSARVQIGATESLEPRALLAAVAVGPILDSKTADTYPAALTPAGSNLFYVVEDSTNSGQELVVTNSAGATAVLHDFSSASTSTASSPSQLTAVGNDVFFATSGTGGSAYDNQLWQSDGTAAGTAPVTIPGASVSSFESLSELNGNLLVILNAGASGTVDNQLWAIPGGTGTPGLVQDFGGNYVAPDTAVGGTLYLSVNGSLWSTDGTAGNTAPVGSSLPTPLDIVGFNNQAYYFSTSNGQVVFGTVSPSGESQVGTAPITGIVGAVASGSSLYFVGPATASGKATQLWATDGTAAGTRLVEDFQSISPLGVPLNLTDANGTLFFTLEGADGQEELWKSNGTAAGTAMVKALGLDATYSGYYGYLTSLKAIGGTVFFDAADSAHGAELWASDGTPQGTRLVQDINPGPAGSDPQRFVSFNNRLYFAAHDGSSPQANQLWTSDGTAAGTGLVAAFSPGITTGSSAIFPGSTDYVMLGSQLLLPMEDGVHGTELWATNGTAAGTTLLAPVNPRAFAVLGSEAYFLGSRPTAPLGLWVTNGTAAGTSEVVDLSQYVAPSSYFEAQSLAASGGRLYFTTGDGNGGVDLWSSGGTAATTSVVKDFTAPSGGGYVSIAHLTAFNGEIAFIADDGTDGSQLWISDGTSAGTQMITGTGSGDLATGPSDLTVAGNGLYFFANNASTSSPGLWTTTGTAGGTSELAAIPSYTPPGQTSPASPTPVDLTAVGSRVFFVAEYYYAATISGPSTYHDQLWTSDGTVLGTTFLPGPSIDSTFANLGSLEPLGNLLIFQAVESSGGPTELWKSDGSAAGTTMVADLSATSVPHGIPYYPQGLAVGGVLYFAANDGVHGQELWRTDGTPGGTSLAADINPGPASSTPIPLAVVGGQLALIANDGIHGAQLMQAVINPGAVSPSPTPTPTSTSAPSIAAIPTQTASDGSAFQANLAAYVSDPGNPSAALTYSLSAGAPAGLGINPSTGVLSWNVPADQAIGTYPVTLVVTASGSPGPSASATFDVNVVDPGPAPVIAQATVNNRRGLTITLTYSQPMDASTAANAGNYLLEIPRKIPGRHRKGPSVRLTPVRLRVSYNAATHQVTLKVLGRVSLAKPLELTVLATGPGGVAKVNGQRLNGSGQAGSDYLATVTARRVSPTLAVGTGTNTITPRGHGKGHPHGRPAARVVHRHARPQVMRSHHSARPHGPMALARASWSSVLGVIPPATGHGHHRG
ncbi:MAG: ELWxxDGT repeat protein [Isosphaeraceae bacterium]